MSWYSVGIAWVGLGLVGVCAMELASRSSDGGGHGPLSQGSVESSIGFNAALIAGAPFLFLFAFGVCLQMLWQGSVPLTNRIWWPARAAKFITFDTRPSRETTLVQMIDLRRRKDPRLRGAKAAGNWPRFQLWETPEATILNTVEEFRWLKDAGLSDEASLQRLEALAGGNAASPVAVPTLRELVARRLTAEDPPYLALDGKILGLQLEMAEKWAQEEIRWAKLAPAYPPIEWLIKRISVDDLGLGDMSSASGSRHAAEWSRLLARFTEGDELWEFSSPRKDWERLIGRKGVALVRDGRPIAHIVTLMN
jgi:hypothetical protein